MPQLSTTVDNALERSDTNREPDPIEGSFNAHVAERFREAADILESQHADERRVAAYFAAAATLDRMDTQVDEVYRAEGLSGLVALPTIGRALGTAIADLADHGRWTWLDRLHGRVDAEWILMTVAGIGPSTARRIHEDLGVETLDELATAVHDGRMARLDGIGPRRLERIRSALTSRLDLRGRLWEPEPVSEPRPSLGVLLGIDTEYRARASAGELPRIAPRRHNPERRAWLPVLHTMRDGQHYTAMFSNTDRAHELARTHDWVVIYADGPTSGRWTVVTEHQGHNTGQRVVRG